jgi:biotin carboxylase
MRVLLLSKQDSYRIAPFTKAAEQLGIEIVRGVDTPSALAQYYHRILPLQFNQPAEASQNIVNFAQQKPVQAIISLDDSASVIAAMASEALRLPHNSSRAAVAARNKYEMRTMLSQGGVACPKFRLCDITDEPAEMELMFDYPAVIKPLLLSGSQGVMRVNNPAEFRLAFVRLSRMLSRMADGSSQILIEDYIPGVEVALEGIVEQGKLTVLALFDKPDPLEGPFFEETIYVTPSRLPAPTQQAIADSIQQAIAALGLYHGPIHAELRVNEQGAWILEVAGRSIGGLCSQTLRFGSAISLEELILRQAVGLEIPSYQRAGQAEGVMMIPIPEAGLLKGIAGVEEAEQVSGVDRVEITAQPNYPLVPLPEGSSYLGFIFASGDDPATVEFALREAHRKLSFKIESMLTLY